MKIKEYNLRFKRYDLNEIQTKYTSIKIDKAEQAALVARNFYKDDINIFESAFMMAMDSKNRVIGYAKLSQGGVASTMMPISIIAKFAVESMARAVIIIHNHPSGDLTPSREDEAATQKIKKALETLEIKLLDHIILTDESYYSFETNFKLL